MVNPFLEKGYKCYFYKLNQNLEPDLEQLFQLNFARIGVFFHLGYFGFPNNNNLDFYLNEIKRQGTFIIEDISHTLFSDFKKSKSNDFFIASIRKWSGMPSGGFFSSRLFFQLRKELPLNPTYQQLREIALIKKGQYIETGLASLKEDYLSLFREAEKLMAEDNKAYKIDPLSQSLIFNLDYDFIKVRRRKNYLALLEATKEIIVFEPVFKTLPDNVTPLFFPIYCSNLRNDLRSFLIEKNIFCPIHWPVPKVLDLKKFPVSEQIYNSILSIPCDQRYDEKDMLQISEAIKSFFGSFRRKR